MRISLTLSLSVTRKRVTVETESAPEVLDRGQASTERADPHRIGFAIPTPRDPDESCPCGGDFPLDKWPGSEHGGHWDTCPARPR